MIRAVLTLVFSLIATSAYSQAIQQSGPVTPGHGSVWYANGYQGDPGPASGSGFGISEEALIVRGTGTPPYANAGTGPSYTNWCDYDAPVTNSTGYHYLCLSPNANGGGLIDYGYTGTTGALPLNLCVNGTCTVLPQPGGGGAVLTNRNIVTGVTDTISTSDGAVNWNSPTTGNKTESLYACNSSTVGYGPVITDEFGNAGLYPINIVPSGSTILGATTLPILSNFGSVRLICDGVSNWIAVPNQPTAVFNWINIQAPTYGAVSDENDSTTCTWMTTQVTCPNKTFTAADVGKAIAIDYAGTSFAAYSSTIASYVSAHVVNVTASITTQGALYHVTGFGRPAAAGTGYVVGDSILLACGAGCAQVNQALGTINAILPVTLPTVNAAGTGGTASATCDVVGTTGYPLGGAYVKVNVTLNGSGTLGVGATINSYTTTPTYTTNMTTPGQEPVTPTSACGALTGAKLSFTGVFGVYNVKHTAGTGFYSALTCSGSVAYATTSGGSGTGATVNCDTVTSDVRWGTDNTSAFTRAMQAANTQSAIPLPNCVYIPAGKYFTRPLNTNIKGFGCIKGDAQFHSTVFLIPNTAGDFAQIVDSGNQGSLQDMGGTLTYSSDTNANQAGGLIEGFSIVGMRSSSVVQNGIMYYGRDQWQTIDNLQCYYIRGRCIGVGANSSGLGSILESHISNVRIADSGDVGIPSVDIAAVGSTSGPNNLDLYKLRIFDSHGPALWIRSCAASDGAHLITLTSSHLEQSGMDGTATTGDILQVGDANCTGETFPTYTGGTVAGTANTYTAILKATDNTYSNPLIGGACVHFAGTSAAATNQANSTFTNETCSATGASLGGGLWIDAGKKSAFTFIQNSANDWQLKVDSANAGNVGVGLFYNGLALGSEAGVTSTIGTCCVATGASPISFPTYTLSPGHPLGQFYTQTVGIANAAGGVNTMIGTGAGSARLGANYAVVGTEVDFKESGTFSTAGSAGTTNFTVKMGGVTLAQFATISLGNSVSGFGWEVNVQCVFTSIGASAGAQCTGWLFYQTSTTARASVFVSNAATALDTTTIVGTAFGVTTQWNTFAAGDTIIANNLTFTAVN